MTYKNRVANIEDKEVILNWKQMAIYIAGICVATFTVAGVYFGIINDNRNIRKQMEMISQKLDKVSDQYEQVMIELAKKQDK